MFVFFDLDDTLWDFGTNSVAALKNLYARAGLEKHFGGEQNWLDSYHAVNSALWLKYNRGEIDAATLRRDRFKLTLEGAGCVRADMAQYADALDTQYLATLSSMPMLVAGARRLLQYLDGKVRMGILSNGFADTQYAKMRSSGIEKFFDTVVLSDLAGAPKPSRQIFEIARRRAGDPLPVLVGDNPDTDIAGALAAGWHTVWFNPGNADVPPAFAADPRFAMVSNLADVPAALEKWV